MAARKEYMLSVRMTESERQALTRICSVSGLPVSTVIRKMICGTKIQQRPPEELHKLYTAVNRIGNNINQIARKTNAGFANEEDMGELKALMRRIIEIVNEVAEQ